MMMSLDETRRVLRTTEEELEQVRKALKASQEENAVLKERLRKAAEMTDEIRKLVPRGACGLCGRFDCGGTCFK
jgi:DNA repair exonuclease SbcCD ATPase subunit